MNYKNLIGILIATTGIVACGEATDTESPDGRDEVALIDGKADSFFGSCGADKLLELLNDETLVGSDLQSKGIHTRAANSLVDRRNGPDGLAGTADDFEFSDLKDVDETPWVGKVAMNQLAEFASSLCVEPAGGDVEVIFSPQSFDESHLARVAELIDGAQDSVDIAMYSFRDATVKNALERAIGRGVTVRMVFEPARTDQLDPSGSASDGYEAIGIDVRYINKIMHHKFAIIDGPREVLSANSTDEGILVSGSGNWSNSAATRYDENTVITMGNAELNMRFQREFNHIWAHSRDFEFSHDLDFFESDSIDETMIPEDPTVHAVFTSDNFKTFFSSSNGETFSTIRGLNTVSDEVVKYIENAETSIWIASGHMRSRPIAEALIKKHQEEPNLDIRVYLDGQEYVSEFTHNKEEQATQDCLNKAGTSLPKQQDCLDKGVHFAFHIQEAGIPQKFKYYAYRWHYSYAEQMHHKYMIVDGKFVLSGSYNYSDNAEHNTIENMVIYDRTGYPELVDAFIGNHEKLWVTGEADGLYDALIEDMRTSSRVPLVFESMALSQDQIQDLKRVIADECPEANSTEFRRNPERHTVCFK